MQVEFEDQNLLELYEKGSSKKFNLEKDVLKKFFMRIQQLEAALNIHDLWKTASLNFERLKGFENRYSVRVTIKWRLEFRIDWIDESKTIGEIYILRLSKHYGD